MKKQTFTYSLATLLMTSLISGSALAANMSDEEINKKFKEQEELTESAYNTALDYVDSLVEYLEDKKADQEQLDKLVEVTADTLAKIGDKLEEELDKKADVEHLKTVYDTTLDYVDESVSYLEDKKADQEQLDKLVEATADTLTQIGDKLEEELDKKADKEQLDSVMTKADQAFTQLGNQLEEGLDKKADKSSVQTNMDMIAKNSASIEMLKANSNLTLAKKVAQNTQRIDNLEHKVGKLDKEIKNGLATQAALNGLFQPYNVGKVNISAAVGGYKSKNAVAVGTGYRFNQNVATKAGVAVSTNGGGVAYNVGVNFEW